MLAGEASTLPHIGESSGPCRAGMEVLSPSHTLPCSAITVGVPAEVEGEICTGLCWQQQGDRAMVRGSQRAGGTGDTPREC